MSEAKAGFVAVDLEGTLTTGATWKGLGRYLVEHGQTMRYRLFVLKQFPIAAFTRWGLRNVEAARVGWMVAMTRLLKGLSESELNQVVEWIVEHELWAKRREDVLRELESLRERGKQIVLVSGAYQPVLEAFSRRMGNVPVVGTAIEIKNGRVTGKLSGTFNVGASKVSRLAAFLQGARLDAAYGDTLPDVSMMEMSREPVAVYPEDALRVVALQRGWRILG